MEHPQLAVPAPSPGSAEVLRPRVVLADDHPDMLQEIRSLLEPEFDVVSSATNGRALLEAVLASKPDVVVTDVEMPGRDGIDAGREIVARGLCQAVVILTVYNNPHLVLNALESGMRGYVLKYHAGEELIQALRAVLA